MGGYKSSELPEDSFEKGFYSPQMSDINFAVPDMKILRSFMPYDIPYVADNSRDPGSLPDMTESRKLSVVYLVKKIDKHLVTPDSGKILQYIRK